MNRLKSAPDPAAVPGAEAVMFSLLGVAHAIEERLEQALSPIGLSTSKLGVLTQLIEAGAPLPLSELAARLSCVRSNMTQLVDRLEADGLVRRVDDPADRRSVLAIVTRLGEDRQAAGAAELARVREAFAAALPRADRAAFARALAALR
ncbi:MAG TPA: MarR family transcriptional regulator [Gemmatimonadales bacterium]|jgi:DNA-binding MarR family transcriptional regulator